MIDQGGIHLTLFGPRERHTQVAVLSTPMHIRRSGRVLVIPGLPDEGPLLPWQIERGALVFDVDRLFSMSPERFSADEPVDRFALADLRRAMRALRYAVGL